MRYDPVVWPAFGIGITTPRLRLEAVTPELAFELADVAATGIHDPATMPFLVPWTDAEPLELRRNVVQYHARNLADWLPTRWHLAFGVRCDGELVGAQSLVAEDFGVLRQVDTGSWLARAHQGRGIGTEMRAAVLHLAFAGLGARLATSGAWVDNPASQRVSQRLGYRRVGTRHAIRRGVACEQVLLELDRPTWEAHRRDDIRLHGLTDDALAHLGAT